MGPLEYFQVTYNPVGRPNIFDYPSKWTPLQRDIILPIANARLEAFRDAVEYVSGLVRQGLLTKQDAVNVLYEAVLYNRLCEEYWLEIQSIIGDAFKLEAK
jgi:hypothetical protein